MQPSCTEPNQLDTKGKREEERGKEREDGGERKKRKREKKGGKAEEKEVFYKKIGFCKFLLGLYTLN